MSTPATNPFVAFAGTRLIASGPLADVAVAVHAAQAAEGRADESILIFDARTSEQTDLDLRGSADDVRARYVEPGEPEAERPRTPGRPKLGVVAREVTLLPRHWEWLASQPGGASVTLRKVVEGAMRANSAGDRVRAAQDATYRFATVMAGDAPGYEEATRALYAADERRFSELTEAWPADVRDHVRELAAPVFSAGE